MTFAQRSDSALTLFLQQEFDHSARPPNIIADEFLIIYARDAPNGQAFATEQMTSSFEEMLEVGHVPRPVGNGENISARLSDGTGHDVFGTAIIRRCMNPIDAQFETAQKCCEGLFFGH